MHIVPALLLAALVLGASCTEDESSPPALTLTATDCAQEDITMTLSGTKRGSGSHWKIEAIIQVKCSGSAVENAELKLEFWWPGGTFKRKTRPDGKYTYRRTGLADPTGNSYQVTLKGNDGEKDKSYIF